MTVRIEKKLTVKTVIGGKPDIKKIIAAHENGGKALPLMEVMGIASDTKEGETTAPDGKVSTWTKLIGTFRGLNLETGEIVRSGVCIMPGAANDLVVGVLKNQDSNSVEFGFRILAQYDESAATNYVYKVEALHQIKENDPLEMLAKKLSAPQLTVAPAPAPPPAEAPKAANAKK